MSKTVQKTPFDMLFDTARFYRLASVVMILTAELEKRSGDDPEAKNLALIGWAALEELGFVNFKPRPEGDDNDKT